MDDKFEILYKQFKSEGYEDCTDKDMNNLLEWSSKINQAPKIRYKGILNNYFIHIFIGIIIFIIILYFIIIYYNKPISLELIESMSNPDNSSDGIDLEVDTTINDDFNE